MIVNSIGGPRMEQWIAQGEAVSSGSFAARVKREAAAREVTALAPDVLVFMATPETVERLRVDFGGRVVIERDAPIGLPPGPGPGPGFKQ